VSSKATPVVVTTKGSLTCTHPSLGPVTLTGTAKLRVGKNPVLLASDLEDAAVGCTTPADPNTGTKQCTKVARITGGKATKLVVVVEADRVPVVLAGVTGETDGTPPPSPRGTPLSAAQPGQTTLKAV
jgi:hypothetical protein